MLGLGEPEHNRKVREERENRRPVRTCGGTLKLWGIWENYTGTPMRESIRNNIHGTRAIPRDIFNPRKEGLESETNPFIETKI